MRYNIIINQVKAKEWGLNLQQSFVFSFLYELPSWADYIIVNDKTYYFASKNKAIEELPILTDKIDTMYRLYKQLEEKELIEVIKKDGKDYVLITNNGKNWNSNKQESEKNPNKLGKKSESNSEKNPTYNNTSIYNINKDNIYSGLSDTHCVSGVDKSENQLIDFDGLLKVFNVVTGKKFRSVNAKARRQFLSILKDGYTKEDIKKAIRNCLNSDWHKKNPHYLTLEFISRRDKFEKYLFTDFKKQVLPQDWFSRELTYDQKELVKQVRGADSLKRWDDNRSAIMLEGGKLYPVKIEYEQ